MRALAPAATRRWHGMTVRLKSLSPRPMATLRLLCIPFAGAGASAFRGWAEGLPPHVEPFAVQLPGREDRMREAAATRWAPVFASLCAQVRGLHAQPTAIFGHSLGAVLGLDLARWMERSGAPPVHLFVSARAAPGSHGAAPVAWSMRDAAESMRDAAGSTREAAGSKPGAAGPTQAATGPGDDAALLSALERRFGALPASLSHPEIRESVLPVLRADLALLADHPGNGSPSPPPLQCPVTVFHGTRDPSTDAGSLAGWRRETSGAFDCLAFDGGHYFLDTHRAELLQAITTRLPPRPSSPW